MCAFVTACKNVIMKHASNFVVRGIKQKVINNNDMITMQIISYMKKKLKNK